MSELGESFWSRVKKTEECWLWTGSKTSSGYGLHCTKHKGGKKIASRAIWESVNGPIPAGLLVCHRCDNPPCVRPDHLFIGTQSDNMRDASEKGRMSFPHARWTHCKKGHPLTFDGTILRANGRRRCRVCITIHNQKLVEQRKRKSETCPCCRVVFVPHATQRYCSVACRNKQENATKRARYAMRRGEGSE